MSEEHTFEHQSKVITKNNDTGCCGGSPISNYDACCVADENAKQQGRSGCGCNCSTSTSTR